MRFSAGQTVGRGLWGPNGRVETVPDSNWHRSPVDKVLAHEMAVIGAMTRGCCEVYLVEMMDDAMHRIKHRAVGVVLATAVLVHQVVHRGVLEGLATVFVAWVACSVQTVGTCTMADHWPHDGGLNRVSPDAADSINAQEASTRLAVRDIVS